MERVSRKGVDSPFMSRFSALFSSFALVAVGCSQGTSTASQAMPSNESPPASAAANGAGTSNTSTPAPTATYVASATANPPFGTCKDMKVDVVNDLPDGGVVMDNAAPVGDAGPSDRLSPVEKLIKANQSKFRCCFDAGGRGTPHETFKMTLHLDLDPAGGVRTASIVRAETDTTSDAVEGCIVDVAKSLDYASSGVAKDTHFNHRFIFKGH